jgi:hypothetical protein
VSSHHEQDSFHAFQIINSIIHLVQGSAPNASVIIEGYIGFLFRNPPQEGESRLFERICRHWTALIKKVRVSVVAAGVVVG